MENSAIAPITPASISRKRSRKATEFNQSNPNIADVKVKIAFELERRDFSHPNVDSINKIPVDDEDEKELKFVAEKTVIGGKKGSDKGNPIWVDEESSSCHTDYLDDPKRKKPMKEFTVPEECCNISMEPKFRYECFNIKNCSPHYCASCVARYVEAAKFEMNVCSIGRWGSVLCEEMIGGRKFYCPFKECSALTIDEDGGDDSQPVTQSECPRCFRLFCAQCKVSWHSGVTCEEYRSLGVDKRSGKDMMMRELAKNQRSQWCPNCKFYAEKISGCSNVRCRCRNSFNYDHESRLSI